MSVYMIYFIILIIAEIVASLSVGYWMPYMVLGMMNHEKSAKIYLLNFIGIIEAYAVHRELRSVSQKTEKAILITLGCMTIWSLILSYI